MGVRIEKDGDTVDLLNNSQIGASVTLRFLAETGK
jgi:hypothetical protein